MSSKKYDLVLFGATSFVGKIISLHLFEHLSRRPDISWAIAGKSLEKVSALQKHISPSTGNIPVIIANALDLSEMRQLCSETRLVLSTVGPYALYGEQLVRACAETGTDYCDVTGETYWIKEMITKYQNVAENTGARLVNCCAFDSIPSDLGVYFLQQEAKKRFNTYFPRVSMRVASMRGGVSGGTIASIVQMIEAAKNDRSVRRGLQDPYQLCRDKPETPMTVISPRGPAYDHEYMSWVAPFVMEATNTRIVLRSASLGGLKYQEPFSYGEAILSGSGIRGLATALAISALYGVLGVCLFFRPLRAFTTKFFLPSPGEGPSEEDQLRGHFDIRLLGQNDAGEKLCVKVTGDRDPGYGSTAKMAAQSALCLLETPKETTAGGFWTPASSMGEALIARLKAHAGLTFEIVIHEKKI